MSDLKMKLIKLCLAVTALFLVFSVAEAKNVEPSLLAESSSVISDEPFWIAVKFDLEPGWHTYYKEAGETGEPTVISLHLPPGFKSGDVVWQKPKKFNNLGFVEYGYENEVYHFIKVTPPANMQAEQIKIDADVTWLSCGFGECVPGKDKLSLLLPVGMNGQKNTEFARALQNIENDGQIAQIMQTNQVNRATPANDLPKFDESKVNDGFVVILLLAFVGGLILNFMPCVFPVISLKLFGIIRASEQTVRKNSVFYTLGVMATFLLVAVVLLAVKSAGGFLGWGFQLQNPLFVLFMICLLLVLGMMFSGIVVLSPVIKGAGAGKEGAFASGMLAVLLASPCVAPFMGTAVAYGLTATAHELVMVFLMMGFGLAFPIMLLSFWRTWVKYMPKSGPWLNILPKVLAIPLYLSAMWLLWVLEKQTDFAGFAISVAVIVLLGLAFVLKKKSLWLCVLFLFAAALFFVDGKALQAKKETAWLNYSQQDLEKHLVKGDAVFVKFSAAWCLTCLVNEKLVLSDENVMAMFKKYGVVLMMADWTAKDEGILKALNSYGKNGVPLYVYYKKGDRRPLILPRIITKNDVEKVVKND